MNSRVKPFILLLGDIAIFYGSLLLTLLIRDGVFSAHVVPFTIALAGWILIYYIGGLYDEPKRFLGLTALGGILLILLLYFVPDFGIAPKGNFFLFMAIYSAIGYSLRISGEKLIGKVALTEINETWILYNIPKTERPYEKFGYIVESVLAFILALILLPLMIVISLLIMVTSKGPAIYTQKRVGKFGREFSLYKFRSMYADEKRNPDARNASPTWSLEGDNRITLFGKFLRASHIDELPQLFNILAGSMSFIGPRPERPEFTKQLEKEIPYYELRNLLKPGITGWAQLNYGYGASVSDARHKLEYDIYYLKNRSFALDIKIILKTLKKFFV